MHRKLRKRLAHMLLRTTIILSMVHGLLPYKYNAVKRKLQPSKFVNCYCLLINLCMMAVLCYTIPHELRSLEVRFLREKPLNAIINAAHKVLGMLTLFGTFVGNWTGRQELLRIATDFSLLQRDHNERQPQASALSNDNRFLYNYIIAKCVVNFLQMASSLYGKLGINPNPSWEYVALTLLIFVTKNVLLLIGSNFYMGLLAICHYLRVLNGDLMEMVEEPTDLSDLSSIDFESISRLRQRLCQLAQRLSAMYQWQVLMLIFSLFVGNIVSAFYFLVYLGGKIVPLDHFSVTLFPQIFLINTLDFYLFMAVCQDTINTVNNSLHTLRHLNEVRSLSAAPTQSVECFALQCSSFKFRFRLCGMLDLNHNSGFHVIVAMVIYLVVLVQFDYKNL